MHTVLNIQQIEYSNTIQYILLYTAQPQLSLSPVLIYSSCYRAICVDRE